MELIQKIDDHLHLTKVQFPKTEQMFVSSAENMLPHMAELGIEKGILMSMGEDEAAPMGNTVCKDIAEAFPEHFYWMCNVDEKEAESLQERLHCYKNQGAVGIGELVINKRMDDPFLQAVFAAAEKEGLPILFHMSPEAGKGYGVADDPGLPLLEENLKKYPNLIFVGHSQPFWHEISGNPKTDYESRNAWGSGPVLPGGRVTELLRKYPNLYADLSANSAGHALMRDEAFGLAFAEEFKDRLIFGTDMVNVDMVFPLGKWLDEKVNSGELSERAYRNICQENAIRIYHLK